LRRDVPDQQQAGEHGRDQGKTATPKHGGILPKEERNVQRWFRANRVPLIGIFPLRKAIPSRKKRLALGRLAPNGPEYA
jgi:hypothetical protein